MRPLGVYLNHGDAQGKAKIKQVIKMKHYGYKEIVELEKTEPNKKLRLHWEGDESEAASVTPWRIVDDVKDGEYTPEQFDKIGYCISEEEYQEEQAECHSQDEE